MEESGASECAYPTYNDVVGHAVNEKRDAVVRAGVIRTVGGPVGVEESSV